MVHTDSDEETYPLVAQSSSERSRERWALGCIFVVQTLHGIAYYAISLNLMTVAKDYLRFSSEAAVGISLAFSAVVYAMPIVGGSVADLSLGRYKTLFYGMGVYLLGTTLYLILAAILPSTSIGTNNLRALRGLYITSLLFVAVSRGFVKPNIMPFGAQQVNQNDDYRVTSTFRWTLWFFNIGKFTVYFPLAFATQYARDSGVLFMSVIQVVTVALSIVTFIVGKKKYVLKQVTEGRSSFQMLWSALKGSLFCLRCTNTHPGNGLDDTMTLTTRLPNEEQKKGERLMVRKVFLMFGIFATLGIFEALYFQMTSTFNIQLKELDNSGYKLPRGFFNSFSPMVVLVIVPVVQLIHVRIDESKNQHRFLELIMIGSGTVPAALSMLSAALIETFLRKGMTVSVFWQIPQFALMGFADILVFIPSFEFCYRECFPGLASLTTGLCYSVGSLFGFIISLAFTPLGSVQGSGDEHVHFEWLFYVLFGIMVASLVGIFIPLSVWYAQVRRNIICLDKKHSGSSIGHCHSGSRTLEQTCDIHSDIQSDSDDPDDSDIYQHWSLK